MPPVRVHHKTENLPISDAPAPAGDLGTLEQARDWLANRIKAIMGTASWRDAPPTTLRAARDHADAAAPHPGHVTDQELVDGLAPKADATALDAHTRASAPHPGHATDEELAAGLSGKSDTGHSHAALTPSGGATGQVLKKNTATNYDYSWQNDAGGPHALLSGQHSDADQSDVPAAGEVLTFDTDGRWRALPVGAATIPDATTTTKGRMLISVAPADPANPKAVGDNDPRNTNARTPTAHSHPASELTATGARDATTVLHGDNAWRAPVAPRDVVMQTSSGTAAAIWTDMPAALTEWSNTQSMTRRRVDLAGYTQARLVWTGSTAGSTNAEIRVQYSTDNAVTWAYLDGAAGPACPLAPLPAGNVRAAGWVNIAAAAKTDVLLRVVGINGDGVADPNFSTIVLQVK